MLIYYKDDRRISFFSSIQIWKLKSDKLNWLPKASTVIFPFNCFAVSSITLFSTSFQNIFHCSKYKITEVITICLRMFYLSRIEKERNMIDLNFVFGFAVEIVVLKISAEGDASLTEISRCFCLSTFSPEFLGHCILSAFIVSHSTMLVQDSSSLKNLQFNGETSGHGGWRVLRISGSYWCKLLLQCVSEMRWIYKNYNTVVALYYLKNFYFYDNSTVGGEYATCEATYAGGGLGWVH